MQVTLEIPDSVIASTSMTAVDLMLEAKRELALSLYGRGVLSAGKAAELAAMSRMAFEGVLAARVIEYPFSVADFEHEMLAAK